MPRRRPVLLAWLARVLGLSAVVLGVGHAVPNVLRIVRGEIPYDLHAAWLLWITGILFVSGGLNLGVSGGLRRGARWAWTLSGVAAAISVLFAASLVPVFGKPLNLVLLVPHALYLAWWTTQRPPPSGIADSDDSRAG